MYPHRLLPDLDVNEVPDFLWSLYNNFTRKVKDKVHNNREKEERYVWIASHLRIPVQILYRFIPKEELQCRKKVKLISCLF